MFEHVMYNNACMILLHTFVPYVQALHCTSLYRICRDRKDNNCINNQFLGLCSAFCVWGSMPRKVPCGLSKTCGIASCVAGVEPAQWDEKRELWRSQAANLDGCLDMF